MSNRDYEYENNNILYDEDYEENRIKCKNYELCESLLPQDHYINIGNYLCMTCGSWFKFGLGWDELTFIDSNEECSICFNNCTKKLIFPTNCGHSFCIKCSKNILFWDETRYHLSPEPYGCQPCPNGCINPIKGEQCYCEEYKIVQDNWKLEQPDAYKQWNDNEDLSIEQGEDNNSYFSNCTCPLCRKKYKRKY
jgi:hypothetical protein